MARAYAPYVIIIAVFSIANLSVVKSALAKKPWTESFAWPGLHIVSGNGKPLSSITFAFGWLPAAGTLMIISGILTAFVLRAPVPVALLSWLPVLLIAAHFLASVVGLYEFAGAHGLPVSPRTVLTMALTWLPYQAVLSYAALRALRRQRMGIGNWEKTAHVGAHRTTPVGEVGSRAA